MQQLCKSCSLAGLVLSFIACFILLVIAPSVYCDLVARFTQKLERKLSASANLRKFCILSFVERRKS